MRWVCIAGYSNVLPSRVALAGLPQYQPLSLFSLPQFPPFIVTCCQPVGGLPSHRRSGPRRFYHSYSSCGMAIW